MGKNSHKHSPKSCTKLPNWKIVSEGDLSYGRYGHTTTLYEKSLTIIGGSKLCRRDGNNRNCLNDVLQFDYITNQWTKIRPGGIMLESRCYHSSTAVGKNLVIYGGMNSRNRYLSDTVSLMNTIVQNKDGTVNQLYAWRVINTEGVGPGPLASHACQLVLEPERYKNPNFISLGTLPEISISKSTVNINKINSTK